MSATEKARIRRRLKKKARQDGEELTKENKEE